MFRICFLLLLFGIPISAGYGQVPSIKGTIEVSIKKKSIACDLTYTNLPDQYAIRLNRVFRRPDFLNEQGSIIGVEKDEEQSNYEGQAYTLLTTEHPRQFRASYRLREPLKYGIIGKFSDYKGRLAFNDYSLRATEQTEWHPVVIDLKTGLVIKEFAYELEIICEDCSALFINGSPPVAASSGSFLATTPYQLMLFLGDYEFSQSGDVYYLNSPLTTLQEELLRAQIDTVKDYYARALQRPYGKELVLIQATPTSKKNAWQFNTYPSIVTVGHEYTHASLFQRVGSRGVRPSSLASTYHEAAHYYFGNVWSPSGTLRWAFLEGFNDYLSLLACRDLMDADREYERRLQWYANVIAEPEFIPLHQVTQEGQINGTYRYRYVPLLLSAIEREIGLEAIWEWLRTIIASEPTEATDYAFFRNTLLRSGISETQVSDLEERYIFAEDAKQNILDALGLVPETKE
ncbi:MAG TPA: hypothetical protein DCE41_16575 [Cytophagales bacterium]|nr:hypothetical protein [Cytophagales bacterium]HAA17626.1 hypothetical protein [Cytophagales bacterium]HAP63957.1 hypothetical protein [Cytophagales bacterium]